MNVANICGFQPAFNWGSAIVSTWVAPTYCVDRVASGSLMINTMYSVNSQNKVPGIPQYFGLQVEAWITRSLQLNGQVEH